MYGILGLYWTLGGAAFPFGENDPGAALSILGGVRAGFGAPVIAALGLAGAVVAVAMARTRRQRGILRAALLGFAWVAAATLTLAIPDYRALVAVSYTPIVVIGAPLRLAAWREHPRRFSLACGEPVYLHRRRAPVGRDGRSLRATEQGRMREVRPRRRRCRLD